ncbi:hypothetical protein O9992_08525 [Vibrio lentus]|nr:hypothetical protein [Vibrio lentus]
MIRAGNERLSVTMLNCDFIEAEENDSACQFKAIEGSRHEVLFEKDEYRNQTAGCPLISFLLNVSGITRGATNKISAKREREVE